MVRFFCSSVVTFWISRLRFADLAARSYHDLNTPRNTIDKVCFSHLSFVLFFDVFGFMSAGNFFPRSQDSRATWRAAFCCVR